MSDEFLNRLVGSWKLTGSMGATELRQRVDARWVIQNQFLQVHCIQEGLAPQGQIPYEAIYMLGYDSQSREYSMHLFDTFGENYARTIGKGTRRENSVEFLFEYPNGLFSNTSPISESLLSCFVLQLVMIESSNIETIFIILLLVILYLSTV